MNDLYAQAQATDAAARQRVEGQDGQITELNAELNRMNDLYAQAQAALDAETGAARHAQMLADTATTAQHRKIAELNAALHNRNLDVDRILLDSRIEMAALTNSHSWRLMAPLRSTMTGMRAIATAFDGFRRASRLKGGMIIGGAIATKILLLEGPRGLRSRLEMVAPAPTAPPAPKLVDPLLCAIVTTPHVMNLAQMMARVLKEEGFSATIRTDLDGASEAGHVFVLCPQMFKNLPDHYVAVQMEQSVSSRWFTPDYFDMLNRARAIIDYSVTNIAFLRVNELPLYKLFHVPLDADRGLSPAPEAARQGILFFGDDKCPRRQRILAAISAAYPQLRVLNNLFGEALERELRQAAVVLNVHYYENALLETARVYQALSYGTPVVSELSSDQADHAQLDGIVDFAPLDDIEALVRLLRPYADGTDEALARRRKITDFVGRAENTFEIYFRRFLLGQNMIGLDRFESRAADYPMPVSEDPMLCLSLPETPDRRALFRAQAQGQAGFQIWDGLKYTPGWVGAALSYRHMFGRLRKANTRRAVICEDDVLFPPDFDARMAVVDRYLGQHEWDVYSGFIADAHADLRVLKVEDFEGQTFVHIDRAVSMVFNIYNHDIMDYLAEWDPTDRDVYSNTIDRYMEKRNGIRVILSVPFLVGHRPDVISTIWGFENTQYDEVVSKSELLLAEKVAEFRSRRAAAEPAPQPALARS